MNTQEFETETFHDLNENDLSNLTNATDEELRAFKFQAIQEEAYDVAKAMRKEELKRKNNGKDIEDETMQEKLERAISIRPPEAFSPEYIDELYRDFAKIEMIEDEDLKLKKYQEVLSTLEDEELNAFKHMAIEDMEDYDTAKLLKEEQDRRLKKDIDDKKESSHKENELVVNNLKNQLDD